MAVQSIKYCEYFDVNEKYFPCIDESAINNGASWDDTYPHNTFIDLLNLAEKMLGGNTNRSIWIHGAYGTGKSKCAYALKKILDVPEQEVRAYWDKFEPLKKNPVLLEKLIGHKSQGIVTAYRYASGSITTPQQLFFAVQESIKKALDENDLAYKGESSLKESVIAWLKYSFYALHFNDKNAGIIAEKGFGKEFNEMLAIALARTDLELNLENAGRYLFDTGYMAKSKYAKLGDIVESAKYLREGD